MTSETDIQPWYQKRTDRELARVIDYVGWITSATIPLIIPITHPVYPLRLLPSFLPPLFSSRLMTNGKKERKEEIKELIGEGEAKEFDDDVAKYKNFYAISKFLRNYITTISTGFIKDKLIRGINSQDMVVALTLAGIITATEILGNKARKDLEGMAEEEPLMF